MRSFQESYHNEHYDYRRNSPHLHHLELYDRLVGTVRTALRDVARTMPLDVLEVGAGHGGFTEPILALGATVTAIEMSRPSLHHLDELFGTNDRFHGVFDPNGTLDNVTGEFSVILGVSVLHHIPDYISFLAAATKRLRPGGMILTLQDPLWYARVGPMTHGADRLAYYTWRVGRGNVKQAMSTLSRRLRHVYDDDNPADMVEYHVVRQGVDERAIAVELQSHFKSVELLRYWSSLSTPGQRLGTLFGITNTFGVIASGRLATDRGRLCEDSGLHGLGVSARALDLETPP